MCGRYSETHGLEALIKRFNAKVSGQTVKPRYNISPGQDAPVIINQDGKTLEQFRWGLIPFWAKEPAIGYKMITARGEGLAAKPSFRKPFQRSRCLVPADGFYEWVKAPEGKGKVPMRVALKSRDLFSFAGLWDIWKAPEGEDIRSFTIITTGPNEVLAPIHNRMPVILNPDDEDRWLDPAAQPDQLLDLLVPYMGNPMEAYPVSKIVNSGRNDSPQCIEPWEAK